MPGSLISKLDLKAAAEAEAKSWRNLIPTEPWVDQVTSRPGLFAKWVAGRLQAGHRNSPGWVVDVRKAHQAFRPVPIVGVAERIALRALTDWVLKDVEDHARSQEDYRDFVRGPLLSAFKGNRSYRLADATSKYVVQADISSFYQYVDHGVLLTELENRTGKIDESRFLIELLGEIQGATYGLPQLLDASDRLSEVYIEILERDLVRRFGSVWRFNDDFRIAVSGYGNAQQALEGLAAAARPLGLVLNDQKSNIIGFVKYYQRHAAAESGDPDVEIHPEDIEVMVEEYSELEDEELERAESLLTRLDDDSADPLDLAELTADEVRDIRRAFNTFAREESSAGLPYVERVFRFVPQLVPRLCDYLAAAHEAKHASVEVWLAISERSDLHNVWQRAWLVHVARRCGFLEGQPLEWLRLQVDSAPQGLLHAELTLALAQAGAMDFDTLDTALRSQPEALSPWYALAMNFVSPSAEQRRAIRGSSRLYELLVSEN